MYKKYQEEDCCNDKYYETKYKWDDLKVTNFSEPKKLRDWIDNSRIIGKKLSRISSANHIYRFEHSPKKLFMELDMPIAIEFEDGTLFGFQFCSASMVDVGFIEGSKIENFETKQVKKQAKMQALISGEEPYTSIDEMFNLASVGDDPSTSFKSMVESVVAHGGKVQLSNDMAEFLKKEMSLDELKAIASGEVSDSYTDNDKELFSYLQSMLGIDYNVIYEEALASKSGSTLTPTPPPESPSKSVDDWM